MGWQDAPVVTAAPDPAILKTMEIIGDAKFGESVGIAAANHDYDADKKPAPWEAAPIVAKRAEPAKGYGMWDALVSGYESSATGLALRRQLPDIVLDHSQSRWYERAIEGGAQMLSDAPEMIVGAFGGAAGGAAVGGAAGTAVPVVGNIAGAAVGAVVGGGAGAFAFPTAIRESLIQAYEARDAVNSADFLDRAAIVLKATAKSALVGGATAGAGMATARVVGPAIAPMIGGELSVKAATRVIGAAQAAAEVGTMTVAPAALEGRLPDPQDFVDAAIVVGGIKGAVHVAGKMATIYAKTGRTPEEVVADAAANPDIAAELKGEPAGAAHEAERGVEAGAAREAATQAPGAGESEQRPAAGATEERAAQVDTQEPKGIDEAANDARIPRAYEPLRVADVTRNTVPDPVSDPEHALNIAAVLSQPFGEVPANKRPNFLNFDYIEQPEDVRAASARISEVFEQQIEEARGKESWEQTRAKAEALIAAQAKQQGRTVVIPDNFDQFRNLAAKSMATLAIAQKAAFDVAEKARAIEAGDASPENVAALVAAIETSALAQAVDQGVGAEVARALAARRAAKQTASIASRIQRLAQENKEASFDPKAPFAENTIFTAERVAAARAVMKAKLGQLNAGLDPEVIQAGLTIAGGYIEAGLRDFAKFSKAMIDDLGDAIKPHLQELFDTALAEDHKRTLEQATKSREGAAELATKYGDPIMLAKMIGQLDTTDKVNAFAKAASKATLWEKIVEAWKAGILSGPVTHVANIVGNATFAVLRAPIDAVAAGFGMLHGGERATAMEPIAGLYGLMQGVVDGAKVAAAVIATGEQPGKSEQFRKAIEGVKGEVVRLPFRFLSAEDAIFNTMNARAEAYRLAARKATEEGINPLSREFLERSDDLVKNPDPEMEQAVEAAGTRFTFNTEMGEKGNALRDFVRKWHLQMVIPFIRTPANILKELVRMTPGAPLVGEWRADMEAGGARRDKAMAELAVGTGVMSVVFSQALAGAISGAGNPDPNKRRVQQAAGWQPYSIKFGDKWYSYQRMQPWGTLVGLAADAAEIWEHMTEDEQDKVPKMMGIAFANNVTNQTFLQGVTQVVNALSDPPRFVPKILQGYAGSIVPAAVAQPTQMRDPYEREVDSMLDAIKSRIPGQRQTLMPKRDVFGEPIASKERLGGIVPITETTETTDPVRAEAARLEISVAPTPKNIELPSAHQKKLGKVELTAEQKDMFASTAGKMAHETLSGIVGTPGWEDAPAMVKRDIFNEVFKNAHAFAKATVLTPDQRQAEIERIQEGITKKLNDK